MLVAPGAQVRHEVLSPENSVEDLACAAMPLSEWAIAGRHVQKNTNSVHTSTISITIRAADPAERHETPDPLRSDAVKPQLHCVGQRTGRLETGGRIETAGRLETAGGL